MHIHLLKEVIIKTRSFTYLGLPKFHTFFFLYFVLNEATLLTSPVFNFLMCTKACYLNGRFPRQKLALKKSDTLAQAGLRCRPVFLPVGRKPAQSWSQSQDSHQSHQAVWAIIIAGTGFRHRVCRWPVPGKPSSRVCLTGGVKHKASGQWSINNLFVLSVPFS